MLRAENAKLDIYDGAGRTRRRGKGKPHMGYSKEDIIRIVKEEDGKSSACSSRTYSDS